MATGFASIPEAIEDIRQGKAHPLDLLFNFLGKLITDGITNRNVPFLNLLSVFFFVSHKKILSLIDLLMSKTC